MQKINKLSVAAVTPYFLQKGVLPLGSSASKKTNPWLNRNIITIETGQKIKLSVFLRDLAELGYSKTWETRHRGEFSQGGGTVHVFPINSDNSYTIEFDGNWIAEITAPRLHSGLQGKNQKKLYHTGEALNRASALVQGDYVVHIDHGIGIFQKETDNDFVIEYASPKNRPSKPDLLFVPKNKQKRLQPYLGFKKPEIHRLGTPIWEITKKKAKEDIIAYAQELLKSWAERKTLQRKPYEPFPDMEEELSASFIHEYTEGQKKVLAEVYCDLSKKDPMDRVVTGDVGFGKTEIALMTAFRAVLNRKQVALIAPTTILVEQHYELFKKRLGSFGVEIERLSRISGAYEIKKTLTKIETGSADIIIGTHKLLGKSVNFKNLGLLVVDEEQKFGVAHKEKFKKLNPSLDILTLTATPIPRTLNFALSGLRTISSIETAPRGRKEIKTFVLPKNKKIIKEAILAELKRGGQIYFLANRIHKIPQVIDEIKSLKTKAKIGILHGRMNEKLIVKIMHDFRESKIELLVSTTIIENGLDLSNANTLIVEDSTRLGLAQAHQLRGRIGRGEKEAYAYFLYPTQKLKEQAAERLEALERYSWLGAGIEIAKQDLEIRGAGNILGKAQSGVAYKVGLNLYFQLLEEAVEELKPKEKTA